MTADFEDMKNCPLYLLVKSGMLFEKMILHWMTDYKEVEKAQMFQAQWAGVDFARVVINHSALVPGGMPCDNNGTEATNKYVLLLPTNVLSHKSFLP